MLVFFTHGTKTKFVFKGIVADVCPTCEQVRVFTIQDKFSAIHIYRIIIGGWSFKERFKQCADCHSKYAARLKDYDGIVDGSDIEELTLSQIVARTNRHLSRLRMPSSGEINDVQEGSTQQQEIRELLRCRRRRDADDLDDREPLPRLKADYGILFARFAVICGPILAIIFSLVTVVTYQERDATINGPVELPAAVVVDGVPRPNHYVRVTDFQVAPKYWSENDVGKNSFSWVIAAPVGDTSLENPKNDPPARLFLIRLRKSDENFVAKVVDSGEVTGLITNDISPGDVCSYAEKRYPGSKINSQCVVRQFAPPGVGEIAVLAAMVAFSVLIFFVGIGYLVWKRKIKKQSREEDNL